MTDQLEAHWAAATALGDPDCLNCLRRKLKAISVAVFINGEDGWCLSDYQGEKPSGDAEIDFFCMLEQRVPEVIAAHPDGLVIVTQEQMDQTLNQAKELFCGYSIVAAPVNRGSFTGVRLALRDALDPFTEQDLETVRCFGLCDEGGEKATLDKL